MCCLFSGLTSRWRLLQKLYNFKKIYIPLYLRRLPYFVILKSYFKRVGTRSRYTVESPLLSIFRLYGLLSVLQWGDTLLSNTVNLVNSNIPHPNVVGFRSALLRDKKTSYKEKIIYPKQVIWLIRSKVCDVFFFVQYCWNVSDILRCLRVTKNTLLEVAIQSISLTSATCIT